MTPSTEADFHKGRVLKIDPKLHVTLNMRTHTGYFCKEWCQCQIYILLDPRHKNKS